MTIIYVAPNLTCYQCMEFILLPYPDLPEITEEQWNEGEYIGPMDSVPDGWSIIFGCRRCGHVGNYGGDWVGESIVQKEYRGKFHSDTNCVSVQLQCANVNCKAPATLFSNLKMGESAQQIVDLLRKSHYIGSLPCGHQLMPIPAKFYRDPRRILNRLW